jgi:hypothetical protein
MCWRKLNADWTEKPIRILFFEFFGGNAKLFQFVVQELPGNAEVTGSQGDIALSCLDDFVQQFGFASVLGPGQVDVALKLGTVT